MRGPLARHDVGVGLQLAVLLAAGVDARLQPLLVVQAVVVATVHEGSVVGQVGDAGHHLAPLVQQLAGGLIRQPPGPFQAAAQRFAGQHGLLVARGGQALGIDPLDVVQREPVLVVLLRRELADLVIDPVEDEFARGRGVAEGICEYLRGFHIYGDFCQMR